MLYSSGMYQLSSFCGLKKADMTVKSNKGSNLLHVAAYWNQKEVLELILKIVGAEKIDATYGINATDNIGFTPLHMAVLEGNKQIVEFLFEQRLFEQRVDTRIITKNGSIPLHIAAFYGRKEMVKLLLEKRPKDINVGSAGKGYTALHFAASLGIQLNGEDYQGPDLTTVYEDIVALLIKLGADIKATTRDGYTALDVAMTDTIKALLSSGK